MVQIQSRLLVQLCQFQRCLRRKLSSVVAAKNTSSAAINDVKLDFICSEQNPLRMSFRLDKNGFDVIIKEKQSAKDLGKYYTVNGKTVSSLFSCGIPKASFLDEVKTIEEFNIMIRKPAVSILERIKSDESLVKKFVIYGQDGCGKTMTLSHILHYCFTKQWCILLIPSVFKIVHSKRNILPSSYNPERFDQPDEALLWLKTFQMLNETHLSQIKTTKEYKVGQKISIDIGEPISTVIKQAFHRPNFATDAVGITLKEIRQLREFPVLFAADEFNGFFWTTSLKNPETSNWLKPQDLSLVQYFEKLFKPDYCLERGSYVMAMSRTGMERTFCSSYDHMQLLTKKGVSCIGSYEPIEVTEYNDEELMQCLTYYQHKGLLSKDLADPKTYQELAFLTDRRPSLVRKMCLPF